MADLTDIRIYCGDCEPVIAEHVAPESVNLIVTSPPYADQRKSTYGGIHPDRYVEWFLPKAQAFHNALAADGSMVVNIKEKCVNGERHTYVLELIIALRKQGWLWTEEYMWHKKNTMPGRWPNRLMDCWERCLHFTKNRKFKMRQDNVKVPIGDWAERRNKNLTEKDFRRDLSGTESGYGSNRSAWLGKEAVLPSNVLHLATECANKGHPAAFPQALPAWFIKLFTDAGDLVLDPFAGSGTTLLAARELGRRAAGIDLSEDYCGLMRTALASDQEAPRSSLLAAKPA